MNHILIRARKLAILGMAFVAGGASAHRAEAGTVYAFAQQKVYDMTLGSGTPSNLTGNAFSIRTSTAATLQGYPGVSNNTPILDALQSFAGNTVAPAENLSGTAPFGVGNTTVLVQANSTSAGLQNATSPAIPGIGELSATNVFTRSDVITRIPTVGTPNNLDPNYLFNPGLAYPIVGQGTRNDKTAGISSTINGISVATPSLAAGTYTFSIAGTTTVNVTVVPEPSSYVMMGLGLVTAGGLRFRRKMLLNIHPAA